MEEENCVNGYFESFTHRGHINQTSPCTECVGVRKREGERGFFDPGESEAGIEFLVPLSEAAIPRNGLRFHLCHVDIPRSARARSVFLKRCCANSEPSPRRLDIPLDPCVEESQSAP